MKISENNGGIHPEISLVCPDPQGLLPHAPCSTLGVGKANLVQVYRTGAVGPYGSEGYDRPKRQLKPSSKNGRKER